MSSPYKYDSSWKTQDLFKNYLSLTSAANIYIRKDFTNLPTSTSLSGLVQNGDILELWWNGTIVQSWEYTIPPPTIQPGQPIGLLLSLTYP